MSHDKNNVTLFIRRIKYVWQVYVTLNKKYGRKGVDINVI